MAITTHTLTGSLGDLVGSDLVDDWSYRNPVQVRAWVETNIPAGEAVVDTGTGGSVHLGPHMLELDDAFTFAETDLIATNATNLNWHNLRYRLVVEYPNQVTRSRDTFASPWFEHTADQNIKDIVEVEYAPPTATSELLAQMEALLATQIDLSNIDDSDSEVATLISNGTFGPLTRAALSASIGARVDALADTLPDAYSPRRPFRSPGVWKPADIVGTLTYVGHDPVAGVSFYISNTNLFISADHGTTYSTGKGLPTGVTNGFSIYKVLRFGALWLMIASDASDSGLYKIYSCAPATGNTALTWTARKTLGVGATNIQGSLAAAPDGSAALASEYTAAGGGIVPGVTGGVTIYRSTNGTTWTAVLTLDTIRHWHGVWFDPYHAGVAYALAGDGSTHPVYKSTDNGVTWAPVAGIGAGWDAVSMAFSQRWVWLTGDVVTLVNVAPFYVFDRADETPLHGTSSAPYSMPVIRPGVYAAQSAASVTSGSDVLDMGNLDLPLTIRDVGREIKIRINSNDSDVVPSGTVILDVTTRYVKLSNPATQSSAAGAFTYIVDRNERYYPYGLYGAVDPATEVFYFHADNSGGAPIGLPFRYGLFACKELFGPLIWLDNLPMATRTVEVVDGYVLTGGARRAVIDASDGI